MYKLRGKIESVIKEDINTSKGDFKKLLFVIEETESGYDHKYQFEIFGEESIAVHEDKIKQERYVIVDFYIKSREWKNKYYNTLMVKGIISENNLDDVPFS